MDKSKKIHEIKIFMKGKKFNTQVELANAASKHLNTNITQSFIAKNKEELGIKKNNDNKYELTKEQEINHNKKILNESIKKYGKDKFYDPAISFLKIEDRYTDIISKQIEDAFPNSVVGTINQRQNLIIIFKNKKAKEKVYKNYLKNIFE